MLTNGRNKALRYESWRRENSERFSSMRKEMRGESRLLGYKGKKRRKMFVTVTGEGGRQEKKPDSIFSSDKSARACTLL